MCFWIQALLLLALAQTSRALDLPLRWRWSNPAPHGGNVFDMAYGEGLTVQVCERGQIYTSDDLAFWQPRNSGTTNSLRGATFFGKRLVITGEKGTVLYADSLEDFHLLNLGTSDWLESVAASANKIFAVGDNGAVYSSTNGINWARQSLGFTNWLRSVAYGNNTFVAVGESGFIAAKNNGSAWAIKASGTASHLNRVSYVGGQFRVVGEKGICLLGSASGQSWSIVSGIGTTNSLYAVAGTNNSTLVAGEKQVRLQENGNNWISQTSTNLNYPAPSWTYYSGLWEGSLYFLAGRSGMMVEGFKTNAGSTLWITRDDSIRNWLWDVTRTTNLYVAVGDHGTVMTSADGVTWDLELVPKTVTNSILLGVGGNSNGLVAVGNKGSMIFSPNTTVNVVSTNESGTLVTNQASSLGVKWLSVTSGTTNDLQGIARWGNLYVACGAGGTILTSFNGTNWSKRTTPTNTFLSGLTSFSGGLVATGDKGTILASPDGTNWTARVSGTTNWIYRVRFLNQRLVAVGENGTLLTSVTGTNWTMRASGTTKWLNGVEYASSNYFIVGNQGTVLMNTNVTSTNWLNIGTISQKSLYGVTSHDGQLITVGIEGAILRAPLVPDLEPVQILRYSRSSDQNIILVNGKTDQRFTLQHSTNLVNWADGVTVELLDRSGSLLFIENADTNGLPQDFLRAKLIP